MSGKIEFGFDYLTLMRNLQYKGKNLSDAFDVVDDVAARLFLLQWGFSILEIDEVNNIFWERADASALPEDLLPVVQRIADHIKDDRNAQERLVIELAAVGAMDGNVTQDEGGFISWFRDLLDMRPSEFEALTKRGIEWAIFLNFFGTTFASERGTKSPWHDDPPAS